MLWKLLMNNNSTELRNMYLDQKRNSHYYWPRRVPWELPRRFCQSQCWRPRQIWSNSRTSHPNNPWAAPSPSGAWPFGRGSLACEYLLPAAAKNWKVPVNRPKIWRGREESAWAWGVQFGGKKKMSENWERRNFVLFSRKTSSSSLNTRLPSSLQTREDVCPEEEKFVKNGCFGLMM